MKKYLGSSAVVLGMFAAAVVACGDEGSANNAEQTKSAITSRGFKSAGCSGAGVFDITSNNAINFVALDNSSFNSLDAKLFSLDKNNQEQFVKTMQSTDQTDNAMTSLLDQVSNFTSAKQRAEQIASQQASSSNSAKSVNTLDQSQTASTANTASSSRDVKHTDFSKTDTTGFNNTQSSRDVNSRANSRNRTTSENSAESNQLAAAEQAARNNADTAQSSGARNSASNSANNSATNNRNSSGSAFNSVANDVDGKVGFGKGGFGFNDISNQSTFANNVFSDVRSRQASNQSSDFNNSSFAKFADNQFSKVFSKSNQSSSNRANAENTASAEQHLHNDARTNDSFDTSNTIAHDTESHDRVDTANSATTENNLKSRNVATSFNSVDSMSDIQSKNASDISANSETINTAKNVANSTRFSAITNLSQLNSNHLVLQLNVTANSQNAIVRVFTGNNSNNVAANQDFNQTFAGCGVGASVVNPKIVPGIAPAADNAEAVQLGDRVAKPEE